jgi:glycosyltransferase involved in cell wall biosynthesis
MSGQWLLHMQREGILPARADVCLIVEGGYPYILGGVASWMDNFVRASPTLRFHVIAIGISAQPRVPKYAIAENVTGITDVILDRAPVGRTPRRSDAASIARGVRLMQDVLAGAPGTNFNALIDLVRETGFGQAALLDSKPAWSAMERVYCETVPNGSLIDFFWTWRFLARSLLAIMSAPLPDVALFHAVSTGYAGLVGAYAKHATGRPYVVTEHGIYTNERRIELSIADWIFDSGASGFDVGTKPTDLRGVWLQGFVGFSQVAYVAADVVTTQYRANQDYQRADGAPRDKLRIIPNGIDVDLYASVAKSAEARPPTALMIGRIVPIKDIRTFIVAVSLLKRLVPEAITILIGPEEEDPAYAAGCRALVAQLGLEDTVKFLGRVPDVKAYLARADVIVLSSISEAQPIALLEAAATGLPAVTTDVGSCREIIEGFADDPVQGRGGFVVPACDPKAMAEALAAILRDRDMRLAMGQVMQKRIPQLYHKERIRVLYEGLYTELLGGADALVRAPTAKHVRVGVPAAAGRFSLSRWLRRPITKATEVPGPEKPGIGAPRVTCRA